MTVLEYPQMKTTDIINAVMKGIFYRQKRRKHKTNIIEVYGKPKGEGYIKKMKDKIPDVFLAPKKRYMDRFNLSILEVLMNVYSTSNEDNNLKTLMLLGSCNHTLKNSLVMLIKPYVISYLTNRRLSIKKEMTLFKFYISWSGGCNNHIHTHLLDDTCPALILFNLSRNSEINGELMRLIYHSLYENKYGYIPKLLSNHGIVL